MAFLRTENKKSGTYLRIVENRRNEAGKTAQHTLYNLGRADHYSPSALRSIGKRLYELGGGQLTDLMQLDMAEKSRHNYGYPWTIRKLLEQYGLDALFRRVGRKHHLGWSVQDAVLLMLCERLNEPSSKLRSYSHQQEYIGLPPVELHHLYRSLDYLDKYSDQVQEIIFRQGRNLFNLQLDVVFYDVTTLYFDSDIEEAENLRQKGFGKDGKIGKTQIVFGLLIDAQKQPVGYRIYPGNYFEGHTFRDAVADLQKTWTLRRTIIVADRGMANTKNREAIAQTPGCEYLMGEKLKSLPQNIKDHLTHLKNYTGEWQLPDNGQSTEDRKVKYCLTSYQGRTIIGTYSLKRAKKDKTERENKIAKAEKMLANPSLIKKKARHYYLKYNGKEQYELDAEKIKASEQYDGFLAIATSDKSLNPTTALEHYHHLYQIEHVFRTFKSHLEIRPMFHWTDARIRGHLCLCYIAYALLNRLQRKMGKNKNLMTDRQITDLLDKMQVSLVEKQGQYYYLRSPTNQDTIKLLKALKLKPMPAMFPSTDLGSYSP